jgi:hypothetical protein
MLRSGYNSYFSKTSQSRNVQVKASADKSSESKEEAYQRRLRESARVDERVHVIYNEQEFREQIEKVSFLNRPGVYLRDSV